ncbi:hypothetical protein A8924_3216 [Saccharopolyspora erythraea NRRL 2338]|uniref:Uncharacterized protein n=2 Tax=Saccharopolyspora erythraea TaxID=1836 RepID=A4FDH8_SACEN|nr:hypothetical protein [Saccharopolyspora erythraea]EQD82549.1 hypothetical protein N599_30025 [Saccharopolyspora erythraea D]PFG95842.1 hypothetical protein A8924_3216 [Saccharopolyspora erythraea NRRL 2338]QRK92422.1 hypothetical protein JQX30_14555 [Saccharopolyspora erythraea]CAM02103.1 hypothetical protein SACE_2824 [Saccharopolyspora erythraea NRRL 2338]
MRHYLAFPFALAGLALGIVGCVGHRRGKLLAVVGAVLSFLSLGLGMAMLVGYALH